MNTHATTRFTSLSRFVLLVALTLVSTAAWAQVSFGPGVQDALTAAAPTSQLELIVAFDGDGPLTSTQKLALTSLGIRGTTMHALPIAGVLATPAQVNALVGRNDVRSVWLNEQLQYENDGATGITGVDRLRTSSALRNAMGLPFTGKDVGVMVNDSGVDGTHPDLKFGRTTIQNVAAQTNLHALSDLLPYTWTEDVDNTDIGGGHGTHVAGTIAGNGQQSGGKFEGVAPGAKIIGYGSGAALFILDTIGAFDYALVNQIRYNIRVVSNSWGSTSDAGNPFDPNHPTNIATKALADRGVIVVFSAGNSGSGEGTISGNFKKAPWVVTVAAGDKHGSLADFSSRGFIGGGGTVEVNGETYTWVDRPTVTAPGVDIISARASTSSLQALSATDDANLSPAHLPYYTHMSGTSMACPHVAGIVALMLEANPLLNVYDVRRMLEQTATNMPARGGWEVGGGYVNAYNAVRLALGERTDFGATVNLLRNDFNANALVESAGTRPFNFDFSPVGETGSETFYVGADIDRVSAAAMADYETTVALVLIDPAGNRYGSSIALPLLGSRIVTSAPGKEGMWTITARGIGSISGIPTDPARVTNGTSGPGTLSGTIWFLRNKGFEGADDIGGHTEQAEIEYAIARRLMDGLNGNKFRPDATLKRSDLAEYAVMGLGVRQELRIGGGFNHGSPFKDAAVARGAALRDTYQQHDGVLYQGNLDGTVNRGDLAYTFVQSLGLQAFARDFSGNVTVDFYGEPMPIADADQIPADLRGYVQIALDLGILNAFFTLEQGTYDLQPTITARFHSDRDVTRAEYAVFVSRFVDNYLGGISGANLPSDSEAMLSALNAPVAPSAAAMGMPLAQMDTNEELVPDAFGLQQNYPNPVTTTATTISYDLPEATDVTLEVYDIQGRRVTTLVAATQEAGRYEVTWNRRSASGQSVASGLYLYRLQAGDFIATKKMTLLQH